MKNFVLKGEIYLEAEDLDDACRLLADYFQCLIEPRIRPRVVPQPGTDVAIESDDGTEQWRQHVEPLRYG